MTSVNIYLIFNGNCEEAFNFYKSVFGGEFSYIGRFGDMPSDEQNKMGGDDKNRIMHVALPISKETVLMASDTAGEWKSKFVQGNNFSISVNTDSTEKADRLFKELSGGGEIKMPMEKTFWGDYFGMLTDKFGINWQVSFNEAQQQK